GGGGAEEEGRRGKGTGGSDAARGGRGAGVLEQAERERVADELVEGAAAGLGPPQVRLGIADATRQRLQAPAQQEDGRAQVVRDRADQKPSILLAPLVALGGGVQAFVHGCERVFELVD